MADNIDQLYNQLQAMDAQSKSSLPPVDRWNPELSGVIDIVIKSNGEWLHEGSPIVRKPLVRLFSSILKKEGGDYYLVTPVEKWQIRVDSYPLFYDSLEICSVAGQEALVLNGPSDYPVAIGRDHSLWVEQLADGPLPVVACRDGLNGVISRNVYYELANRAVENDAGEIGIWSGGCWFSLEAH
ncbi:DUF1285 domain-containing protein [Halioxenophilus sp. WMMB6]|uniref:DUF1285 domain-containing protein n=1 Tax=Halioxenophilus sp. WMMB6 TaxID=3073815 RepID=UPI00295EAF8A|nr:DUF1285 domain-containing protein [Halioxenophilus sp. WMMB6]